MGVAIFAPHPKQRDAMVCLNMMGSSTSLTACSTGASMTANTLQTTIRSPSDLAVGVALRMANDRSQPISQRKRWYVAIAKRPATPKGLQDSNSTSPTGSQPR
jgi:hypothetical protein